MEYRVGVCDDSQTDRTYVADLARRWAQARGHVLQLTQFPSAESLLFRAEEERFDILLLDIEMGAMDGVTLARQLRRRDETVQIVFVTGYSDYISEGYEVAALHYLMKPVGEEKLCAVLDRAAENLRKNERLLKLELGGELVCLPLYQVRYVDIQRNYATVHAREDYTVKRTLGELAEELDERFYRVGRSVIVNLTCIRRVTRTEICLQDGTVIPLPRGAYEGINRAIISQK